MRIEKLRLSNINSLRGTWVVDFEDPELQDAGLVLITGPTGSGKSTLLDAICLALYGRTPRLDSIAKSGNEAMTRRTGFCIAEVIYSTDSGRYRAKWSQRRARNKAGGNLQDPEYEFEDCGTSVLTTGKRAVQEQVETTTGMTFEQFTRSMMLAQGQFSRFLQAKPAERTSILEEITGTGIYAEISKRTFEKARDAETMCKTLEQSLNAMHILTDEQREHITQELADKRTASETLKQDLAHKQQGHAWQQQLHKLSEDLARAETARERAVAEDGALEPCRTILAQDVRAARLDVPLSGLDTAEKSCRTLQTELGKCRAALPSLQERERTAVERVHRAEQAKQAAETALSEAAPLLKQVREYDTSLASARKQQKNFAALKKNSDKTLADIADRRKILEEKAVSCAQTLAECDKQLCDTAADADLARDMRAIDQSLEGLRKAARDLVQEEEALAEAVRTTDTCTQEVTAAEQALASAQHKLASLAEQCTQDEKRFLACTGAGGLEGLRTQAAAETNLVTAISGLSASLKEYLAASEAVLETRHELSGLAASAGEQQAGLPEKQKAKADCARHVTLLEENARLRAAIMSLEEHRATLKPGTPCPCCGSLEHPWAEAVSMHFADETELAAARKALDAATKDVQDAELALAKTKTAAGRLEKQLAKQLSSLDERAATLASELAAAETACANGEDCVHEDLPQRALKELLSQAAQICGASGLGTLQQAADSAQGAALSKDTPEDTPEDMPEALSDDLYAQLAARVQTARNTVLAGLVSAKKVLTKAGKALSERIRTASEMEKVLVSLRKTQAAQETACTKAAGDLATAQQKKAAAVQAQTDLAQRCTTLQKERDQKKETALTLLAPYGIAESRLTSAQLSKTLHKRLEKRAALEKTREELTTAMTGFAAERTGLESEKVQAERQDRELSGRLDQAGAECLRILKERQAIFAEKDPDREEEQLNTQKTAADREEQAARKALASAQAAVSAARGQQTTLTSQLQEAEQNVHESREEFARALAAEGFASREELAGARLKADVRADYEKRVQAARDAVTRAETLHQQLTENLARHQTSPLASEFAACPAEDLANAIAEQQKQAADMEQELGVLRERLHNDAKVRQERSQESARVDQARLAARQWRELSELIGSADGKKFRNFAQEVTFVHLVRSANEEIRRLTDRYLLTTAPDNALDFNVIDTWQGDEQRSIRNLSGGETFMVSLALALGLASLSGAGRMHIETMFLDEGFGTLDPDALDSAINTLAGLRSRGTGLVGIISHVEALQERVDTQIVLARGTDGVSTLSGPGCSAEQGQ